MKTLASNRASDTADLMAKVADEFLKAKDQGLEPDVEEFAERYPEIAPILRDILPALTLMNPSLSGGDSPPPDAENLSSRTLGDFRIEREIGRGGMGVVYQAEQISLGRTVALKVLPFAAMLDPRQLTRFRNEARAAAALHHTNIVPVFSVGCERGVHFYAMQYIEGESLASLIASLRCPDGSAPLPLPLGEGRGEGASSQVRLDSLSRSLTSGQFASNAQSAAPPTTDWTPRSKSGAGADLSAESRSGVSPLSPTRRDAVSTTLEAQALLSTARSNPLSTSGRAYFRNAAELGIQAAEALDYAHEQGVVHRDIKPANLILDETGRLWITDFGLARMESDAGMTMTGDLVGTLRYMSPEQALAKRVVVDHRTDIYSLGVTLYELLTLRPVFDGEDRQHLLKQIAFEEPAALRKVNRQIPIELETIVLKAIRKNPEERYATSRDLADDLRSFLANKPIKAKPPGRRERLTKWSRRHPALLLSAAVIAAVIAVGSSVAAVLINGAKNDAIVARNVERQSRERADQQSELALKTMKLVVFDIQNKLGNVPAAREVRQSLLATAIDGLKQVSRAIDSGTKADETMLKCHMELGDTFLSTLGSTDDAREQFQRAVDIAMKLVEDDPHSATKQSLLAGSYGGLGSVEMAMGNLEAAHQSRERAFGTRHKLAQDDPRNVDAQRDLACSFLDLAEIDFDMLDLARAQNAATGAFEIRQKLAHDDPNSAAAQRDLADSYKLLSEVIDHGNTSALSAARVHAEKEFEIRLKLAEDYPLNVQFQCDLAQSHQGLAHLDMLLGNTSAARDRLQKALNIWQRLAQEDPHNAKAQIDVAGVYHSLGTLHRLTGDLHAARVALNKAVEIHLANDVLQYAQFRSELASIYQLLWEVDERMGDVSAASEARQKALKLRQTWPRDRPRRVWLFERDFAFSYARAADSFRDFGRLSAALDGYQEALAIIEELAKVGPLDPPAQLQFRRDLVTMGFNVAKMSLLLGNISAARDAIQKAMANNEMALRDPSNNTNDQRDAIGVFYLLEVQQLWSGDVSGAREASQKALEIAQKLALNAPQDAKAQLDLAFAYGSIGDANLQSGSISAARDAYQKALEIRLANDDPDSTGVQRALALTYNQIGDVELRAGNSLAARDAYQKGLNIVSSLVKVDSKNIQAQTVLTICYARLGHMEESAENFPAAARWFEQGRTILERLDKDGTIADEPRYQASLRDQKHAVAVCSAAPKALDSLEFALAQPKEIVPELLGIRAAAQARRGKIDEAAATADKLGSMDLADGRDLFHAAVGFALCSDGARPGKRDATPSPDGKSFAIRFADRAIDLLKQAKRKGYFENPVQRAALIANPNLDLLRPRKDFQSLVSTIWDQNDNPETDE